MTSKRAPKGGTVGINGERYSGGTFLPSTQLPKRAPARAAHRTNRHLVEPGVIATIPDGSMAIFPQIQQFVSFADGRAVVKLSDDHPAVEYYFPNPRRLHALVAMFNRYARHYPSTIDETIGVTDEQMV